MAIGFMQLLTTIQRIMKEDTISMSILEAIGMNKFLIIRLYMEE
jgi:hypothetical protein